MGFPPQVGSAVAQAVVSWSDAAPNDLIVELGAGTGEIGLSLARGQVRYLGLDNSPRMLDAFRAKAGDNIPDLVVADCDALWPVADATARAVFASRVIHLLQPDHVVRETLRVCRPDGFLMLGRVRREPDSLKERLQRQRQALLRERGIQPRQGESGARGVIERCVQAGCESLGRRVVAEWHGETSVAEILAAWDSLSRMGSVEIEPATRTTILAELREWASREISEVERREPFREQYVVDLVRVP